jgi:hypothetical protein
VSRLVEDYLRLIAEDATQEKAATPVLARWRGTLKGSRADGGDYRRYLEKKYL